MRPQEVLIIDGIEEGCIQAHRIAKEKGWWVDLDRNEAEIIALIHSEASEALEALRHGNPQSDKIPGFTNLEEEYADILIRIFDHAAQKGLRVGEAVVAKMKYNQNREHRHGGKEF